MEGCKMDEKKLYCKRCGCEAWRSGTGNHFHCLMLQHDNGGCDKNCHFPLGVIPKNMITTKEPKWLDAEKLVNEIMQKASDIEQEMVEICGCFEPVSQLPTLKAETPEEKLIRNTFIEMSKDKKGEQK